MFNIVQRWFGAIAVRWQMLLVRLTTIKRAWRGRGGGGGRPTRATRDEVAAIALELSQLERKQLVGQAAVGAVVVAGVALAVWAAR